jgi:hypothetical protein
MLEDNHPQVKHITSAATMDSPHYDDKWFSTKKQQPIVRRYLKRWTEDKNVPNDMQICGNIYSHYFN